MKLTDWKPRACTRCHKASVERKKTHWCFECRHPDQPRPLCRICESARVFYNGYCERCHWSNTEPRTCLHCFAYGRLGAYFCKACLGLNRQRERATCPGCQRHLPLSRFGLCRLCLHQGRLLTAGRIHRRPIRETVSEAGRERQLFFADMLRSIRLKSNERPATSLGSSTSQGAESPAWPAEQLMLFDLVRDVGRWDSEVVTPGEIHLRRALEVAERLQEQRGWPKEHHALICKGLTMLLSGQPPHRKVPYTEAAPLAAKLISVERVVEVLEHLDLFHDDRPDVLEEWAFAKIAELPEPMRQEVRAWISVLRGQRGRARRVKDETIRNKIYGAGPALREWARQGHLSLREITRADVDEVVGALQGHNRRYQVYTLKSLFKHLHQQRVIFRDPTVGLRAPNHRREGPIDGRLDERDLAAVASAAVDPVRRLLFVLAAVHGLRTSQMRALQVHDVDLGGCLLHVGAHTRPLGSATGEAAEEWLRLRRARWPACANPHLLVSRQTAYEDGPVSSSYIKSLFYDLGTSIERIRIDRQLEELLVHGPDPLHFAAMFGAGSNTSVRYARAAAALLGVDLGADVEPDQTAGTRAP